MEKQDSIINGQSLPCGRRPPLLSGARHWCGSLIHRFETKGLMRKRHRLIFTLFALLGAPGLHAESYYYEFSGIIQSSDSYDTHHPVDGLKAVPGVTQKTYVFEIDFNKNTSTFENSAGAWKYFYSDLLGEGLMASEIGSVAPEVHKSFNVTYNSGAHVGEICGGKNGVRILSSALLTSDWKVEDWKTGDRFSLVDLAGSPSGGGVYYYGEARLISIRPVSGTGNPLPAPMAADKTVATNFVSGSSGGTRPGALAEAATTGPAHLEFDALGSTVVALTGFEAWAAGFGIPANETNDDDHDGISALLEYALGYDPTVGNLLPVLQAVGATYQITWPKGSQAAADPKIAYGVEVSSDMMQWNTPVKASLLENATGIVLTLPADRQHLFARLRVTRTEP